MRFFPFLYKKIFLYITLIFFFFFFFLILSFIELKLIKLDESIIIINIYYYKC